MEEPAACAELREAAVPACRARDSNACVPGEESALSLNARSVAGRGNVAVKQPENWSCGDPVLSRAIKNCRGAFVLRETLVWKELWERYGGSFWGSGFHLVLLPVGVPKGSYPGRRQRLEGGWWGDIVLGRACHEGHAGSDAARAPGQLSRGERWNSEGGQSESVLGHWGSQGLFTGTAAGQSHATLLLC